MRDFSAIDDTARSRAAFHTEEVGTLRRARRLELALSLLLLFGLATAAVQATYVVNVSSATESPPGVLSPGFFSALYRLFNGLVTPEKALTAVVAALAVCATINVSLAVNGSALSQRAQVSMAEWRRGMRGAAWVLSLFALAVGFVVWANVASRQDIGSAVATSVFAGLTAYLALNARRYENDVERAITYLLADDRLGRLTAWRRALKERGVPPRVTASVSQAGLGEDGFRGTSPTGDQMLSVWPRQIRLVSSRIACLGAWGAVSTAGILIVLAWIGPRRREGVAVGLDLLGGVLVVSLLAGFFTALVGLATTIAIFNRWTGYETRRVSWHLDRQPVVVLVSTVLGSALLVWLSWFQTGFAALLLAYVLLLGIAVPSLATEVSRRWPKLWLAKAVTSPLWGTVELYLNTRHAAHQREHSRYLREEQEDHAEISVPAGCFTRSEDEEHTFTDRLGRPNGAGAPARRAYFALRRLVSQYRQR